MVSPWIVACIYAMTKIYAEKNRNTDICGQKIRSAPIPKNALVSGKQNCSNLDLLWPKDVEAVDQAEKNEADDRTP